MYYSLLIYLWKEIGFPSGSAGKETACNGGDMDLIPGLGRSCGGENSNPLQYSCLKNPMDRGTWQTTVQRVVGSNAIQHTHIKQILTDIKGESESSTIKVGNVNSSLTSMDRLLDRKLIRKYFP